MKSVIFLGVFSLIFTSCTQKPPVQNSSRTALSSVRVSGFDKSRYSHAILEYKKLAEESSSFLDENKFTPKKLDGGANETLMLKYGPYEFKLAFWGSDENGEVRELAKTLEGHPDCGVKQAAIQSPEESLAMTLCPVDAEGNLVGGATIVAGNDPVASHEGNSEGDFEGDSCVGAALGEVELTIEPLKEGGVEVVDSNTTFRMSEVIDLESDEVVEKLKASTKVCVRGFVKNNTISTHNCHMTQAVLQKDGNEEVMYPPATRENLQGWNRQEVATTKQEASFPFVKNLDMAEAGSVEFTVNPELGPARFLKVSLVCRAAGETMTEEK